MGRAVKSLNCTRVVPASAKAGLALDSGRTGLRLRASEIAFSSALDFLARTNIRDTSCLIVDVPTPRMFRMELHRSLVDAGYIIPTIPIAAYADRGSLP
jgi:hypothetical protein